VVVNTSFAVAPEKLQSDHSGRKVPPGAPLIESMVRLRSALFRQSRQGKSWHPRNQAGSAAE
jgi:hypothetical protein